MWVPFFGDTTHDLGAPMKANAHPLVRFLLGFTSHHFLALSAHVKSVFQQVYGKHLKLLGQSGWPPSSPLCDNINEAST